MTADRERRVAEAIWAEMVRQNDYSMMTGLYPPWRYPSSEALWFQVSRAAIAAMQEPEQEDRSDG